MYYGTPPIVTNGLVLALDAGNTLSYVSGSTTWNDLSGNRNSGSLVNGPTFSTDGGGSIVFDGSNDFCQLPTTNIIIGNNQQNITVCQWVRYTNNSRFYSLGLRRSDADGTLLSFELNARDGGTLQAGTINLFYRNTSNTNFNSAFHAGNYNDGRWHMIAGVVSSTQGILYIDGNIKTTINEGILSVSNSPYNATVGAFSNSQLFFNGNISQTKIYNRALSASEIQQNYNALKTRFGLT